MSSKFLVGLDPSFTRTGICIINLHSKEIFFETASCKIGEKLFENVYRAAKNVVRQICDTVYKCCSDDFDMISEAPLPCSSMSPALHSLDTLIYNEFETHIKQTYNPATLRSKIHGRKYDKKDSVELASKYLGFLSNKGYSIKSVLGTKKKIPHDCCEAFLYSWLYLHDSGNEDFQFDNQDEIKSYKERMKNLKRQEKLLLASQSSMEI